MLGSRGNQVCDISARAKRDRLCGYIMQLTNGFGWGQIGRLRVRWCSFRSWLPQAGFAVLATIALTACEPTRPFERSADGSVVYGDQLSEAQNAAARDAIVRTLDRGLAVYAPQIGDEFEVFFNIEPRPMVGEYRIFVGDQVSIDFLNDTANSKVVLVRPDGRISMPLIGAIVAAGKTSDQLARELERRYADQVTVAGQVTVNLTKTHSPLDDFIAAVGPSGKSRSIVSKVLPDGTISLPLLRPIPARGLTLDELKRAIDAAYAEAHYDIAVSLVPRNLRPGTVLVLGEVPRPGRIELDRPQTVLMSVAQVGGVLTTGSMEAVRVFYIGADQLPHVRSVNLKEEIEGLRLDQDMIVPSYSVIYVPPTELAKTGRFLDAVLRDILRFQGFSAGGTFLINNPTNNTTSVIQAPAH